jgi:hypothetical protein
MGITTSNLISNDIIVYDIRNTIKDLIKNYEIWTNEKLCTNLETVYNGKLVKLSIDQLRGITTTIGYANQKQLSKAELCKVIINHYKKRIDLLNLINNNITKCADMISSVKKGPICKNVDAYIDDFFKCNSIPQALWIDKDEYAKIIKILKENDRLSSITTWVENLEEHYIKSLKRLLRIIDMIKRDIDTTISEIEFQAIEHHTKKVINNMTTLCEIYYLLAVNHK